MMSLRAFARLVAAQGLRRTRPSNASVHYFRCTLNSIERNDGAIQSIYEQGSGKESGYRRHSVLGESRANGMADEARWFVLKQGKIFWFSTDGVTQDSVPRGIIDVNRCLSIKGAEDAVNRPHAFEISTADTSMFFIADTDKEKEDWINAVGRAIVRHSRSMLDQDQIDYNTAQR